MMQRIDQLEAQAQADLDRVASADDLEAYRIKYLGQRGVVKELMGLLKDVPAADKPAFGKKANEVRKAIEQAFADKKATLGDAKPRARGPMIDVTEPPLPPRMGRSHIITQTIDDLVEVFGRMGFDVATGPEIEDEWHNFDALNIPADHPARDPMDNFYLESSAFVRKEAKPQAAPGAAPLYMLRSQTSTIQIRVMEKTAPPLRVVAMGRVYRPDEHDATHYSMFHQVEGLYVDRKVSMADLKTTLIQFAHAMFGPEAEVRLVPSYFPFTEPSAELYVKIELQGKMQWMELGGCGMVDPAVFQAVGYDPEEWTGFAFGLGIERLAMRKHNIQDIRLLFENDVRFLKQF
ncbi:MAG: phenylalanine--tRNA ligase subunit alpha [Phycisphaeraceae bacterium]